MRFAAVSLSELLVLKVNLLTDQNWELARNPYDKAEDAQDAGTTFSASTWGVNPSFWRKGAFRCKDFSSGWILWQWLLNRSHDGWSRKLHAGAISTHLSISWWLIISTNSRLVVYMTLFYHCHFCKWSHCSLSSYPAFHYLDPFFLGPSPCLLCVSCETFLTRAAP